MQFTYELPITIYKLRFKSKLSYNHDFKIMHFFFQTMNLLKFQIKRKQGSEECPVPHNASCRTYILHGDYTWQQISEFRRKLKKTGFPFLSPD